jgi:hypothetical protein
MADTHAPHEVHHGEHPFAYDRREPNYKVLLPFVAVCFLLFLVIVFGVSQYYEIFRDQLVEERVLQPESQELHAVRAMEQNYLNTYGVVDKDKGVVRIPIERAMQLVAADAAAGKPKYNTNAYSVKSATAVPVAAPAPAGGAEKK